jgi:hypothetical protein
LAWHPLFQPFRKGLFCLFFTADFRKQIHAPDVQILFLTVFFHPQNHTQSVKSASGFHDVIELQTISKHHAIFHIAVRLCKSLFTPEHCFTQLKNPTGSNAAEEHGIMKKFRCNY